MSLYNSCVLQIANTYEYIRMYVLVVVEVKYLYTSETLIYIYVSIDSLVVKQFVYYTCKHPKL